ncbi:Outer membrane protein TolC [Allochromatium warmingii]|uniref:Outer membrane protein TolC n=1 Tax=Allochromatium warmingii TaxID=61595 RepID=A0A1H3GKY9_ALLWA|nr:TolC family protein [Allochromatium warmingii]SDY03767.1 Outer membrane protein TolC [Allochromatium warmingii]
MLDFGVSYYRARQKANELLMAEERRQRVIQNILQDVRVSYWRALAAQELEQQTRQLHLKAQQALEMYRRAEREGVAPRKETLDAQRAMLDAVTLLSQREQDLEIAKRELAALMSIPPNTPFRLADRLDQRLPPLPTNARTLEDLALRNRPELREEDYKARITADDIRARFLSFFPSLSPSVTLQYDSNTYNRNQDWIDSGLQIGFNLLKLPALPAAKRVNDAQVKVDDARRMALSMAILTQVRVALERYRLALHAYELAQQSQALDTRLANHAKASLQAQTGGELDVIRANTRALNSDYALYSAFASAQSAYGRIYNSVGLAVLPATLKPELSLTELAEVVATHVSQVQRATLPETL